MFSENCRLRAQEKVPCRYCQKVFSAGGRSIHERNCILNPLVEQRLRKICSICGKNYWKKTDTCSRACSNRKFRSGENNGNWTGESYTRICFQTHEKKCVVCGEINVVEVHHINGNHDDHDPKNLCPMCPTHHRYCHSKFKHIVDPFIEKFLENNSL